MPDDIMTTTTVARYYATLGYPLRGWQVRRAYETGLMLEPKRRMGMYRLIERDDLPQLEAALQELGYLPRVLSIATAEARAG